MNARQRAFMQSVEEELELTELLLSRGKKQPINDLVLREVRVGREVGVPPKTEPIPLEKRRRRTVYYHKRVPCSFED